MKVFISWSGPASKAVAEYMRGWLKSVIQAVEPWISAEDIERGSRWGLDVARQLSQSKVGIICLTSANLNAPWILFEAGVSSKTLEDTYVIPYLLGVEPASLTGHRAVPGRARHKGRHEAPRRDCESCTG